MPVRTPNNRFGGRHMLVSFPSVKLGRAVACESLLEADAVELLEGDPAVEWYEEQPFTIEYLHEGRIRRFTPDLAAHKGGGRLLIECKPDALVDTAANRRKFAAARAWCAEHGWTFEVWTDVTLRAGHRLANGKRLRPYAARTPDPRTELRAREALTTTPGTALPLGELAAIVSAPERTPSLPFDDALADLLTLLRLGRLAYDPDAAPLTRATPVRLPDRPMGDVKERADGGR